MYGTVKDELATTLREIEDAGLYKRERELSSPAVGAHHHRARRGWCRGAELLREQLPRPGRPPRGRGGRGEGAGATGASAWPACGSSAAPRSCTSSWKAPCRTSSQTEDTILYSSCFDANGGVFEVLFGAEDAIISDELNHASIIDGIRLSKAKRFRYKNADMADLRTQLEAATRRRRPTHGRRHRRRLLDGRLPRPARPDLRPRRRVRRDGAGRRQPRRRVRRRGRSRHPRTLRRDGPGRHHHRHPGQGPRRRLRRLRQPPTRRSSTCCASAPAPTCSPTPSPPASRPGRSRRCEIAAGSQRRPGPAAGQHRAVPRS